MDSELKATLHQELVSNCIVRTCYNCELRDGEKCSLAPTYTLPVKVIIFGCPKWIPFIPF
jgi:hypothetical protein